MKSDSHFIIYQNNFQINFTEQKELEKMGEYLADHGKERNL